MKGHRPELKAIEGGLKKAPPLPEDLPSSVAGVWVEIAVDLIGRKLLSTSMLSVLETYCRSLWMARVCAKAIVEHGPLVRSKDGALRPNPAAAMLAKANDTVARLAYEMGLSAAGRNLPSIKNQTGTPDDDDDARLGI